MPKRATKSKLRNFRRLAQIPQKPVKPRIFPVFSKFSNFSSDLTFSARKLEKTKKSNFSVDPENSRTFGANSRTFGANSRTLREIPARFGKIPARFGKIPARSVFCAFLPFFRVFSAIFQICVFSVYSGTNIAKLENSEIWDFQWFEGRLSTEHIFDVCKPYLAAVCKMKRGDGSFLSMWGAMCNHATRAETGKKGFWLRSHRFIKVCDVECFYLFSTVTRCGP